MDKAIVLVDEQADRQLVKELADIGYNPEQIQIQSSNSLLTYPLSNKPKLLILDITTPELHRIIHRYRQVPIMVVATEENDELYRLIAAGAQDFIIKDAYTPESLRRAIQKASYRSIYRAEKLVDQKNDYETILSTLEEVVWSCSKENDNNEIIYINESCYKVYGYTAEEFMADASILYDCVHPDDKEKAVQMLDKLFEEGKAEYEFRIIRKDGQLRYIKSNAIRMKQEGDLAVYTGILVDITHVIEAEKQLSEQRLAKVAILESIPEACFILDEDWRITYMNKEAEQIYNINRENILNTVLWEVFDCKPDAQLTIQLKKAAREQVNVYFESISAVTGKWLSVRAYPNGNGLTVYFIDISEQKKLSEQIEREREELITIINNTKDIIWSLDQNMKITLANEAFYNRVKLMTGVSNYKDVQGSHFESQLFERWISYFERALANETFKIVEYNIVNGRGIYDAISFNPIRNKEGIVTGVSCFSRDITDEKKLQQKILTDDQNLKALIDNTEDFIWSVDVDMCVISANQAYKSFILKMVGELPDTGVYAIWKNFPDKMKEQMLQHYQRALMGEQFISLEEHLVWDKQLFREMRFNPIRDVSGLVIGVSCFARDVTEQRRQLMKIRTQNEQLAEIAWIQSHKIRGPVATILGLLTLMDSTPAADPSYREMVAGIKHTAAELDNIIHEVINKTYDPNEKQ